MEESVQHLVQWNVVLALHNGESTHEEDVEQERALDLRVPPWSVPSVPSGHVGYGQLDADAVVITQQRQQQLVDLH